MSAKAFEKLIFKQLDNNYRYTQDSPVYPDVWMAYLNKIQKLEKDHKPVDLKSMRADVILTPNRKHSSAELLKLLRENLLEYSKKTDMPIAIGKEAPAWELANTGESVVARLSMYELIHCALPLTPWWQNYLWGEDKEINKSNRKWLKEIVGYILWYEQNLRSKNFDTSDVSSNETRNNIASYFDSEFLNVIKKEGYQTAALWSVSKNREASLAIYKSIAATKADACRNVFNIDCARIAWAVLDTGIDARHVAFKKNDKNGLPDPNLSEANNRIASADSRIVATYDFTKFRTLMANIDGLAMDRNRTGLRHFIKSSILGNTPCKDNNVNLNAKEINDYLREIEGALRSGRMLDWSVVAPLLRIPHNEQYQQPINPHGTHVAGIIGANWVNGNDQDKLLIGMCPGISLYDIRVLDDSGAGEEFNILAAIQFVRWLNRQNDNPVIHGVNLSMSMLHEVASFACGRTPVCDSCDRLVMEGTVVVAAAGNLGQAVYLSAQGTSEQGFRTVNISDPGNAQSVITVGATHRNKPHTYGVSYFSSRGPTGDGRLKPDLVAPGEKVISTIPNGSYDSMDGSSMAAPHVSGAAALIMAKHQELIGQPARIKEILCKTATDLGRERYFQGHGLVDVLRAIQSV